MRSAEAVDLAGRLMSLLLQLVALVAVFLEAVAVTAGTADAAGTTSSIEPKVAPRYLVYPPPGQDGAPTKVQLIFGLGLPMEEEVSTIIGYVMKCNYNLPYNASYLTDPYYAAKSVDNSATTDDDESQRRSHRSPIKRQVKAGEDEDDRVRPAFGRYEIYNMIEMAMGEGRACMLRAICEAAAMPLSLDYGVFAELLHVLLTPSSTEEKFVDVTDQQYHAAEFLGRTHEDPRICGRVFADCPTDPLEYLSIAL
ncbi:hypothetical protein QAD02_024354 [Eretmocerus hayati]|uniref:Uncharacterized protein n=1 Tax=Eretmocerus hayati TaxID=131215 RepID=A0ACC2PZ56_9HYME|nr:hypothetical protein QAD02_024354 [Eretmocerus hayati]